MKKLMLASFCGKTRHAAWVEEVQGRRGTVHVFGRALCGRRVHILFPSQPVTMDTVNCPGCKAHPDVKRATWEAREDKKEAGK